jgi:hypothetical protein
MIIEGATKERLKKSIFIVEPRTVTKGGMVLSIGHKNMHECYLDVLLAAKNLGNGMDSTDRYNSGIWLRNKYYSGRPSGKSITDLAATSPGYEFSSGEDDDYLSAMEQYRHVMRILPQMYRKIIHSVCIDDAITDQISVLKRGLDALGAAIKEFEKNSLQS